MLLPLNPTRPADGDTLSQYLSAERLRPYLVATHGRTSDALDLYRWNIAASSAVYESLHVVEVVLRNTIDARLREWNGVPDRRDPGARHGPDWTLDPCRTLRGLLGKDLPGACARARKAVAMSSRPRRDVTHGDVVAHLTLGTWRYLLPARTIRKSPSKATLWRQALGAGFPHIAGDHRQLVDDVETTHLLRNRVAHLEPLIRQGVIEEGSDAMRRVVESIHPDLGAWHVDQSRIAQVLADRPALSP